MLGVLKPFQYLVQEEEIYHRNGYFTLKKTIFNPCYSPNPEIWIDSH